MIPVAALAEAIDVLEAAAVALKNAIADHETPGHIAEDVIATILQRVIAGFIGPMAAGVVVTVGKVALENSTPGTGQNIGAQSLGKIGSR